MNSAVEIGMDQIQKYKDCAMNATIDTFRLACNQEIQTCENRDDASLESPSILAVMSLIGDVRWTLCLGLPKEVAVPVASSFAGFEIPFESSDMGDAVGELANILAGNTKAALDTSGAKVEISLPSVLRGKRMELLKCHNLPSLCWDFKCAYGVIWVEVVADKDAIPTRKSGQ